MADGDDAHGEVILVRELSTGKEAKLLGPGGTNNTIASENAVDTNSVVEVVSGLSGGEVVDIVVGLLAFDLHDFSAGKALPVEAKLIVETSEPIAEQANKLNCVWSDIDAELSTLDKADDGSGQQVLERGIAAGKPPYEGYQGAGG